MPSLLLALSLGSLVESVVIVQPGHFEEPCFPMAAGERLEYGFTSSGAMDFNLHYHEGSGVHYPVRLKAVRAHSGDFVAESGQTYCLMWSNRGRTPVELDYHYRLYTEEVEHAPATGHR